MREQVVRRVGSGTAWEASVGYSRAVRVGDHVHVAGTTAVRDGEVVGVGDAYEQARVALQIVGEALDACGASFADVVRTRLYVTDIRHWEEIGRAHGEVFADVRPAATMVQVSALIDPDLLVEVEAEAVVTPPGR
ncbi:RidA family protein [Intrasporangium sp. YIM S08009]|uniref:RidA family protein n=1 Tax=Intrasporangium zincisolvens TaxID=3080018 RepID=UPI002B0538A9|nr:RidA family protein [Intrasporangium sp. YIM S08009]